MSFNHYIVTLNYCVFAGIWHWSLDQDQNDIFVVHHNLHRSIEYLVNCRVLINFLHIFLHGIELRFEIYRVALKEWNSRFLGFCSEQRLSFFTLLDRTSFPHYNNTKIIKFGWKLFILWVISYGLSFSGFAINFSLVGGPPKTEFSVNFLGLCSDKQLFLSPCSI